MEFHWNGIQQASVFQATFAPILASFFAIFIVSWFLAVKIAPRALSALRTTPRTFALAGTLIYLGLLCLGMTALIYRFEEFASWCSALVRVEAPLSKVAAGMAVWFLVSIALAYRRFFRLARPSFNPHAGDPSRPYPAIFWTAVFFLICVAILVVSLELTA